MADTLNYSGGQPTRAVEGTGTLLAGYAVTYLGVLLLSLWASLAIEHFQRVEGQSVLFGTPRWPHYLRWGGEVQERVGGGWVLTTTTVSVVAMARRRARPWQLAAAVFGNLAGIVVLLVLVEMIGFRTGLLP